MSFAFYEYLIATNNPGAYPQAGYNAVRVVNQQLGDGRAVLQVFSPTDPTRAGDTLIGGWDQYGKAIAAIDQTLYEELRPFGNDPDGTASSHLRIDTGFPTPFAQHRLGSNDALYFDNNAPFVIDIRHKEFFGTWAGWGWRAEIVGAAAQRDPSVRAIGVYSDPECTQYEYTTGAFVQGESAWQRDEQDNLMTVWFTETPAGRANPTIEDWHLAVLWASVQEGHQTLSKAIHNIEHLYWSENRQN